MIIRDLFEKKIDRPINGVIKADQRDRESIWQELDEYVITNQLTEYFRRFFDAYLAGFDRPEDPVIASRMGVWVSGFFGSGKSHFIKILSYLLENIDAINPATGSPKPAAAFFDETKVKDSMLRADIQRAAGASADVILFNIDAKADSKTDRDVILQVFLRVFNEKLGFSGDAPHIANMERHLVSKGVYDQFKTAFLEANGARWEDQRDAVDFYRDDVVQALTKALGMSEESAGAWFDKAGENFKINIEGFAELIRDYLNTKPANHRIVFLVDEIGQFIGDNTQLMLNLQTITEQLGTLCHGRAWIIVTSQEDMDAAIGDANKARSQDFSKIQGRFHTRLSLASSNTDEVIGKRLLAKTEAAHTELRDVFAAKGDIINNQLAFSTEGVTLRGYKDAKDYVENYPFAPYQFTLLSKIFEAIRRHGATGKHLSKGERSLLDAFQTAAKGLLDENIDCMVPLYEFYPSIQSFLDSTVRHTVDNAEANIGSLFESFDIALLKTLFLIKYIPEIVKGSVDNLATLCVDEIDADKLVLKRKIQESLARLEKENLVNRNGDDWMFLTNEEQDIAREIGHEVISADELTRKLAELMFDQVWKGHTKVRHRDTKADYEFNRLLDGKPYRQASNELVLEVISELNDDYSGFTDAKCRLYSAATAGRAVLRLNQGNRLYEELQTLLKVEQYIVSKYDSISQAGKKILALKKDENREREDRLRQQLEKLVSEADLYAVGGKVELKVGNPGSVLDEAINYLVTNTYNKLGYLKPIPNPQDEIRAVLTSDSMGQGTLLNGDEQPNALALKEMRDYLHLKASVSGVTLDDVVRHFSGIPYGWQPDWEIVLLVARLMMAGEISLQMDNTTLAPAAAVEPLTKSARFKQVSILKRKKTGAVELKKARDLYKSLFSSMGREDEDGLVVDYQTQLNAWNSQLIAYLALANQPHYPGKAEIESIQSRIKKQLAIRDQAAFIEALLASNNDWLDAEDDLRDLQGFYDKDKGQIGTWRRLLSGLQALDSNRHKLEEDAKALAALKQLDAIRDSGRPYGQINQIEGLLAAVEAINQQLVEDKRDHALTKIDEKLGFVQAELNNIQASVDLSNRALRHLQLLRQKVESETSIAQIFYLQDQAAKHQDTALDIIAEAHAAAIKQAEEEARKKAAQPQPADTGPATKPTTPPPAPAPAIKPTKIIRPAALASSKPFLETEAEVEAYVGSLREALLSAIKSGQRVKID